MPDITAAIKELEEKGTIDGCTKLVRLELQGEITDANMHRFVRTVAKKNVRLVSGVKFDRDNLRLFPNLLGIATGLLVNSEIVENYPEFYNLTLIDNIVRWCYFRSFNPFVSLLKPVLHVTQNATAQMPMLFSEDYKLENLRYSLQQHIAIICDMVWEQSDRKNWEDNIIAVHFKALIESNPIPSELIAAISKVKFNFPLPPAVVDALEEDEAWLQYILQYDKAHIATFVREEYKQIFDRHMQERLLAIIFRNHAKLLLQQGQVQALKDWCEWISAANHKGVVQEILIDNFMPELFSLYLAAYRREYAVENKAKLLQQIFKCAAHRLNSLSLPVSTSGSENINALLKNNLGEQYQAYASLVCHHPVQDIPIDPVCTANGSIYDRDFIQGHFKRCSELKDMIEPYTKIRVKTTRVVANKAIAELLDKILCSETSVDLKQCLHILINPKIPVSSSDNITDTFFQYPYLTCNGETVEHDGASEVFCSNEPIRKLIDWVKRAPAVEETEKPEHLRSNRSSSSNLNRFH